MKPIGMLDLKSEHAIVERELRAAIDQVLNSHAFIGGPQVGELEQRIADLVGVEHAVAVSSGTDALLAALMVLGIGPGDEVITTPFTFFATAGCIYRTGARPVFVDIEPDTFNIDPAALASAVTPRTKAIIPVHLFGQCADMDAVLDIAGAHGLKVIEDAAQAIGAAYRGRNAGTMGDMACFSFYPTKNLGGYGEGGMITTSDAALALRCRQMRNHGETRRYHHAVVGGNFRLDTLKAAMLLVKMRHLDEWNARRRRIAEFYNEGLGDIDEVQTPVVRDCNRACYHQYSILCDRRDALREHLSAEGIASGIYYPIPLHLQECFAGLGYTSGDLPVSEQTAGRILSLPVHPMLTDEDCARIVACIRRFHASSPTAAASASGGGRC